jgi:hypothetical protein
MGRAIFIADDPADMTEARLETLIPDIKGVTHWQITPDGEVLVEYDEQVIGGNIIEEALAGIGFRVRPLALDDDAGGADSGRAPR